MGFKFLINQGACGCDAAAPLLLRRGFEFLLGDIDRVFLLDELQIRVGWKTGCRFALPCDTPTRTRCDLPVMEDKKSKGETKES
jgi:hypothetical protein